MKLMRKGNYKNISPETASKKVSAETKLLIKKVYDTSWHEIQRQRDLNKENKAYVVGLIDAKDIFFNSNKILESKQKKGRVEREAIGNTPFTTHEPNNNNNFNIKKVKGYAHPTTLATLNRYFLQF